MRWCGRRATCAGSCWEARFHLVAADARKGRHVLAVAGPGARRAEGRALLNRLVLLEKLDAMVLGFLSVALVADGLRVLC